MTPEYTSPNEVRWIWNNPNDISIVQNGATQSHIMINNIPLHHLIEFSNKFKNRYIKIPYLINGNNVQVYFNNVTKTILIEGKITDRRKKGYLHPLIIELEEWDNAIKKIEELT